MTYSHITPRSPSSFTANPAQDIDAYFAALAPAFAAVSGFMMVLITQVQMAFEASLRSGYEKDSKAFRAAVLALVLLMMALKGSRAEKDIFLEKLFARLGQRLARIYARYIIWRQRMCWMWGGGLRCGLLSVLPRVFISAEDHVSFDALIPN